jgi:hypothetical protein
MILGELEDYRRSMKELLDCNGEVYKGRRYGYLYGIRTALDNLHPEGLGLRLSRVRQE